MKRRVTLRVESLDSRIVPGSNSIRYGQETNLTGGAVMLGCDTEKLGAETNLLGGSKPSGAIGSSLPGATRTGIELLASKTSGAPGENLTDVGTTVELFGNAEIGHFSQIIW
jgi:hypothetical protein